MVDWSMYVDIQTLKNMGLKKSQAAKMLQINRETVTKYWDMPPDVYDAQRKKSKHRRRKPDEFKDLIVEWLTKFPDITINTKIKMLENYQIKMHSL